MNALRIAVNIVGFFFLIAGGVYLVSVDSFTVRDMLLTGWSLYLLAASLFFFALFAAMVALGWMRGSVDMPPSSSFRWNPTYVDPVYKGELMVRYWYIVGPAFGCFMLAFVLAGDASHGALP